jgi:hypothetical protein
MNKRTTIITGLMALLLLAFGCSASDAVRIDQPNASAYVSDEEVVIQLDADLVVASKLIRHLLITVGLDLDLSVGVRVDLESGTICVTGDLLGIELTGLVPCETE